jgi:hypothetical protein
VPVCDGFTYKRLLLKSKMMDGWEGKKKKYLNRPATCDLGPYS